MDSMCRLCLVQYTEGVDLFKGEHSRIYAKHVKEMFRIELQDLPGWPQTACSNCTDKLNEFREFEAKITASQEKLLQLVSDIRIKCEPINNEESAEDVMSIVEEDPIRAKCASVECEDPIEETESILDEGQSNVKSEPVDYEEFPEEDFDDDNWSIHEEDLADPDNTEIRSEVFIKEETYGGVDEFNSTSEDDSSDEDDCTSSVSNERHGKNVGRRSIPEDAKLEKKLCDLNVLNCQPCDRTFSSYNGLNKHFRTVHKKESGHIVCCGVQFKGRIEVYDHMKYHLDKNAFKCEECGKCCTCYRQLQAHKRYVHAEITGEFKCKNCEKVFKTKADLTLHLKSHIDPEKRQWKCPKCDKRFNHQRDQILHLNLVHEKTKTKGRIECDICGEMVANKSLSSHKTYKHPPTETLKSCSVCGKAMSEVRLRRHMKDIHSEKRFPCTTCGKEFKRLTHLKRHIDSEHLGIVYNCPYCPYSSRFNGNLKKHHISQHPEKEASLDQRRKPRPKTSK